MSRPALLALGLTAALVSAAVPGAQSPAASARRDWTTYGADLLGGRQYLVVAVSGAGHSGELLAFRLPARRGA